MNDSAHSIATYPINRFVTGQTMAHEDQIAIEAPLEIRLKKAADPMSKSVAVTMRTPGNDIELALGFLFTEGIIRDRSDFIDSFQKAENVVEITVSDHVNTDMKNADRNFYTTSSCGVCGKASIEAIKVDPSHLVSSVMNVSSKTIHQLLDKMNATQGAFQATGGIHASALFDQYGALKLIQEDVGRHNALDKLIGHYFGKSLLPLSNHLLLLSGRASFELVQKAAMAGIPLIAAIGAPSSLAIDLAIEHGITLLGFVKHKSFNCYSGHERIQD